MKRQAKSNRNNVAIADFMGEGEGNDLRQFEAWYSPDTIRYLIHSQFKYNHPISRVVFSHPDFITELEQYCLLKNAMNMPALFIAKEPGIGENHFIFGAIYQDKLLIINPVGKTNHKDFYQKIKQLKERGAVKEILVSDTVIQKDPKGLVSCGPICVELCKQFSKLNIPELFSALAMHGKPQSVEGLSYTSVDCSHFLPLSLKNISKPPAEYHKKISGIRASHLGALMSITNAFNSRESANEYFNEDCINAPEQVLLAKLLYERKSILDIFSDPLCALLKASPKRLPWQYEPLPKSSNKKNIIAWGLLLTLGLLAISIFALPSSILATLNLLSITQFYGVKWLLGLTCLFTSYRLYQCVSEQFHHNNKDMVLSSALPLSTPQASAVNNDQSASKTPLYDLSRQSRFSQSEDFEAKPPPTPTSALSKKKGLC